MANTRINPVNNTVRCDLTPEELQVATEALVIAANLSDIRFVATMNAFLYSKQLTRRDMAALDKFKKLVGEDPRLALACDLIGGKPKVVEIEAEVVEIEAEEVDDGKKKTETGSTTNSNEKKEESAKTTQQQP